MTDWLGRGLLAEVMGWWAARMSELLPAGVTGRKAPAQANALVVAWAEQSDEQLALSLRRNGKEALLGRVTLDAFGIASARRLVERHGRYSVALRARPGMLLERTVVLPLAAERDPARVLQYEMDRLTPFRREQIFWSWTVADRDRARECLVLRLSFVPKAPMRPLLDAAARLRLTPAIIEAADGAGGVRTFTLAPVNALSEHTYRRAAVGLGAASAGLAVAALVLPFVLQHVAARDVSARIAGLQHRVAEVEAIRRSLSSDTGGTDAIAAERARVGDALQVIATVTDILPDNTFLTDLTLHQGRLALSGQSGAAASLIAALAASPVLRNPAFTAPVTRADNGQGDLFSLSTELAH